MFDSQNIALVIPVFNEERLIGITLAKVPLLFKMIYVVDDGSTDNTVAVIQRARQLDPRIVLLSHGQNLGPGAAIISGYTKIVADGYDIAVVVGGDDQMDLEEIERFLQPILSGYADYVKGNRFFNYTEVLARMPKLRIFGNMIITGLTKIASGYYHIFDVVDGYTAISKKAIERVDWRGAWKGYGYPMDFLIRLNAGRMRVLDTPRKPIYLPGEKQSKIRPLRYAVSVTFMLLKGFVWRIGHKYLLLDFHPLALFLFFGVGLLLMGFFWGCLLTYHHFGHIRDVTGPRAVLCALLILSGLNFFLFGILFDREESNQHRPGEA